MNMIEQLKKLREMNIFEIGAKIFLSTLVCILMLCGAAYLFLYWQSEYYTAPTMFELQSTVMPDDPAVKLIVQRCMNEETGEDKVYCVNRIVSDFFVYNNSSDWANMVDLPSKTLTIGGVCRDSAVTYCAIFRQMNITCTYHSIQKHIFNIVDLGKGDYCVVDMEEVRCRY